MRHKSVWLRLSLFSFIGLLVLVLGGLPIVGSADTGQRASEHWLGTWATSPSPPDLSGPSVAGFNDQTLREIVYTHFGGKRVRVRLTNVFGAAPMTFGQVDIALRGPGASIVAGSDRTLTFDGSTSVTVPADAEAYSDPVGLTVRAGQELAVSIFLPSPTGPTTWHSFADTTSYIASGNQASDATGRAYTSTTNHWFLLDGVDVAGSSSDNAVVTLGDSITDGTASTLDANNRWPDFLARRLNSREENHTSVLDEGIGGNRVLNNAPCCGVNALARLDRDVLSQDGVRFVTLLEGINDIGFSQLTGPETAPQTDVSADQIIAGYKQIIAQVHLKGLKIYGATLTPFKGARYETPAGLVKRGTVNNFIRNSGAFDAVIDFDKATRDPNDPEMFLPAYDSGDHLHPNDAGYQAMANAIPLQLFRSSGED